MSDLLYVIKCANCHIRTLVRNPRMVPADGTTAGLDWQYVHWKCYCGEHNAVLDCARHIRCMNDMRDAGICCGDFFEHDLEVPPNEVVGAANAARK